MKANHTFSLTLELTEEEANWLNAVMQNPLHGESPEDEHLGDAEMRRAFFKATHRDNWR